MHRRRFLCSLACTLAALPGRAAAAGDSSFTKKLGALREKHQVPALAAARFDLKGITQEAATGFRKAGGTRPVTTTDLWHTGSMTKAMTATLLATYVQEGRLKWEDPLGKLIPDSCQDAAPAAAGITVLELLQHRSGLPANLPDWWALPRAGQRGQLLRLAAPPGTTLKSGAFLYSNIGYAIAGHLAGKLDHQLWEDLIQKRLFRPLQITAGQGPAGREGTDDQPWPHDASGHPLETNGPASDNPPSLGPAGRVHLSLENYARFAIDHLKGATGGKALLPPALYQILHQPDPLSHYACGWGIAERPWAGGRCLTHTGSNEANYFAAWLAPEKGFGVIAATNQGGPHGAAACDAACGLLIG